MAALGAGVLYSATGGVGRLLGAAGATVTGFFDDLRATPSPRPSVFEVADAPLIEQPEEPYTNQPAVDLVVTVPTATVGNTAHKVRLYLALAEQAPAPILEQAIGSTPRLVIPGVALTAGANAFTATIVSPGDRESEPSPVVTFILDQAKPKITLSSPRNGATINGASVTLTGKTQGRSSLVARNDANNASVTGAAASDGAFKLTLSIDAGPNPIRLTATDPAGNAAELAFTVRRGSGKLAASILAAPVRFRQKDLPDPLTLTVSVTDPDGGPLAGARVNFVVTIPGVRPVSSEIRTGADGKAVFRTTVPKGAATGQIGVSVLVKTTEFGSTTTRTAITIAK